MVSVECDSPQDNHSPVDQVPVIPVILHSGQTNIIAKHILEVFTLILDQRGCNLIMPSHNMEKKSNIQLSQITPKNVFMLSQLIILSLITIPQIYRGPSRIQTRERREDEMIKDKRHCRKGEKVDQSHLRVT